MTEVLTTIEANIGKDLSRLCKLHHVIAPKEEFKTHLRASRLPIPFGMRALGMKAGCTHGAMACGGCPLGLLFPDHPATPTVPPGGDRSGIQRALASGMTV
jgi:hypothetical protein